MPTSASLTAQVRPAELLAAFAEQASALSNCPLAQVYLCGEDGKRLFRQISWLDGLLQSDVGPVRFHDDELLHYCIRQNRSLSFDGLGNELYRTDFLPSGPEPWQALLCLPMRSISGEAHGLLVCASRTQVDLGAHVHTLGLLGAYVIGQLSSSGQGSSRSSVPLAGSQPSQFGLIGRSQAMRKLAKLMGKVMQCDYRVLLTGETGTGKELVARALHDGGPRRSQPFLVQNCAALPEHLLESELFGFRKGAFTGADRDHKGLLDAADRGTLLLDEIGDMPMVLQAKLLRFLQEGEVRPLGALDIHQVDVRIIAATHCDLPARVANGEFREDLYYRLMQFPIELPPLREREGDVEELANHFAHNACQVVGCPPLALSQHALGLLCAHPFPGNVRELKALIERAVLLCEGDELLPEHFGLDRPSSLPVHLRDYMAGVERAYLLGCLRRNGGNQTVSARQLGLPRRTLIYRMGRLNIGADDIRA